ncbi:hypothetical protein SAMN04488057_108190 [Cyclobacterium lianum]|uniref:Ava_C0101 and related proteins n=1 Tax=Cyclobacterium lianum TaxID=388280 RepID=A0A1M7PG69_9BACT|nr:DUF5996 family protein [Cyclobacterium lianum]SHN16027.1 hypothetical protein SAMN04488057_108190 [Cyclobacterium lianum]
MEPKDTSLSWPILNFHKMEDTIESLHQWTQIVGKIRLRTMPWQNHSWHCTLYLSPHGFSTQSIPYQGGFFQIDFDLRQHELVISCAHGQNKKFRLRSMSVADFYHELFEKLSELGIVVTIHGRPNELEHAIPFKENTIQKSYDRNAAFDLWKAMAKTQAVFSHFRSDFTGKCSPVHLFWGAFDLAVTRFSGRPAPLHPGGAPNMPLEVMQEAYSKEVSSAGFWPGSKDFPSAIFYSYVYPADPQFAGQPVLPKEAFYSAEMGEFILKYEDVQKSNNPEAMLMDFLQSTYQAAAKTSGWNRSELERNPG